MCTPMVRCSATETSTGRRGTADCAGRREVAALTDEAGLEEGADLPVDRRDGESGGLGDLVAEDRGRQSDGAQHLRGGPIGEGEVGGGDVDVAEPRPRAGNRAPTGRGERECGTRGTVADAVSKGGAIKNAGHGVVLGCVPT